MSRSSHGSKGPGYEYWKSRLHWGGEVPGRYTKTRTHRHERRQGVASVRYELDLIEQERLEDEWDELWDFSDFEWLYEDFPEEERQEMIRQHIESL